MTTPSQFDPLAQTPHSLRGRIARKLGRTIEPMAVNLLAWCRSLDHRIGAIEGRLEGSEAQVRSIAQAVRTIESNAPGQVELDALGTKIDVIARRTQEAGKRLDQVEARVDQCFWGREALVERMNGDDAREAQYAERLTAVEARADQLAWGREALVERMNHDDATVEAIGRRLEEVRQKVDEQLPLPLSFGLDYLAMGRRLASLEDQVETLLAEVTRAREVRSATLVAYPASESEKAVG